MEELLERVSAALTGSLWLAPLFAVFGGVLTSLMPCSLSTVPLVIGCALALVALHVVVTKLVMGRKPAK